MAGIIIDSDKFTHLDSPWEPRYEYMNKMMTLCGTIYEESIRTTRAVNCLNCIKTVEFCKKVKKKEIRNG